MRIYLSLSLLVGSVFSSLASTRPPAPAAAFNKGRNVDPGNEVIPGAYIVKLANEGEGLGRRELSVIKAFHKRASDLDYSVRHEYADPTYFFGLSIDVRGETNVTAEAKLLAIPNVVSVFPVWKLRRPGTVSLNKTEAKAPLVVPSKEKRQVTLPKFEAGTSADLLSHLKLCDIDRLHDLGIKGKGMRIAILDTGVDYRHPSLGGGFGPGYKIGFGAQYVDDDWLLDGPDPLATCGEGGHGTHVAGSFSVIL